MSRALPAVVVLGLLAPRALLGQEPSPSVELPTPLERQALVAAVLERNPSLEAMRQAWLAAEQREAQARSLEDPTVYYGVAPLSIGSDRVNFGQEMRLSQRLPYPGTLRLRGEMARAEAEEAGHALEAERLRLAQTAAQLFDEYAFVAGALEINQEHIQLLDEFQHVATTRYAAGLVPQQDPLQAEVEAAHVGHRQIELRMNRDVLRAQINALLHRPTAAALPEAAPLAAPRHERPESAAVEEEAVRQRPEIARREAAVRAREAEVGLKRLEGRPAFEAMASYNSMWMDAQHRLMVGVGVSLPVWRKRVRAGVAEAEAKLAQTRSERAAAEDEVRSEAGQAYARLQELGHAVELYRSRLLPATRDQVRASLAAFKTSQTSFLSVIDAERNQRTVEMDYLEVLRDYAKARSALDRALGRGPGASGPAAVAVQPCEPGGAATTKTDPRGERR